MNSDSDVQWEDGSLGKERTVAIPTKAKVFTAYSDGCQASVGFDPPIPDHNTLFAVPCDGGFTAPDVINVVIPANKPQATTTLLASGCTNGVDYYTITWKDQTGKTLSSDIAGRTNVTFYSADAGKQFNFTATCARTHEVKTTLVTVTQAKPATAPSQPTTPTTYPVVSNITDPCNFILSTKYSDSYDVFAWAENVEIKVQTTGNIQAFVERASDGLVPSVPSISNNIITISHQAVDGTFWVKVINVVDGRSCVGYIFITVNNNKGVYLSDNIPKQPAYTPKPVQSPKSQNCSAYANRDGNKAQIGYYYASIITSLKAIISDTESNFGAFIIPKSSNKVDLALVDKVCATGGGNVQWFTNPERSGEISGVAVGGNLPYTIIENGSLGTYYGRCVFANGNYCDTEVTIDPNIILQPPSQVGSGKGRVGAADGQTATNAPCTYSKQEAVKSLLSSALCDKLIVAPGNEQAKLEAIKAALAQQGIALADITDAMVADLAAGNCAKVVTALTNVPKGTDDIQTVADLDKVINNDLATQLVSDALEAIADDDVIDTDFVERDIETFQPAGGLRVGDPNARLADPGTCPAYYFSPAGKRIIVPGVQACTVSINGVLMKFQRGEKTYIPLFSRTTQAFLGYYEQTAFLAKAEKTVVNGKPVDIAPKPALTDWVNDIEYPNEETGIARYRAFIEINKTKPGVILGYDEDTYKQILDILAQLPDLHFQTVEGNGSPFLYDMVRHLKQLRLYKQQSDDRLAALVGIVNNPAYVCPVATPPAANADPICKVYSCVYNSSLKNSDRDLLNARLDLDTRKKLLTLLAEGNLTSGWVPVGCAASADGEGAILSLLSSTQENDRKAILDHIYGSLVQTSYSPLQAFITNLDGANFDALMSLLTSWVSTYYPSSESWSSILQRQDRAKRNILVLGNFTDRYSLSAQYNANQTLLSFEVSVRLSTTQLFKRKIDALDYVVVKFAKDYTAGNQTFESGRVYQLPAVLVYELMNAMQRQSKLDVAKYATYGVFAALGVGEIVGAETGLELTLALLDMGIFGTDIAINEVLATKLNQTADGRAFLDKYNKYTMLYGVARFYAEFANLTAELKSLSNKLNDPEVDKLVLKLENQALVAWLSKYPNLLKKVSSLDDPTQELFRSAFAKAGDATLTVLDGHTASIDTWFIHTDEGKTLMGTNADVWTNQIRAQSLLKQAQYEQVASLLGKSLSTPYTYKGFNYVVDGSPDLKALDDAIAIVADNTDLAKIASNLGIPQSVVNEVKQHFFVSEHLIPLNGELTVGRFERTAEDIALWKAAMDHGFTKDVVYRDPILGNIPITKELAKANFIRILAHEYVESKLMKEGISYRGLLGNTDASAYSFGAHDLTIGDKAGKPEYIWKSKMLFKEEPIPFNGDFSKLDPIVQEILTKVR